MPRPPSDTITFYFDGRKVTAQPGDTIASALMRSGIYTLARSLKLHRRRGVRCGRGFCRGCLVEVNGIPNVPACTTQVEEGMRVRSQNAFPNARSDLLSILDVLPWLTSSKSIYEGPAGNPLIWPLARRLIDRLVGLGRLPSRTGTYGSAGTLEADVAVVGAGIAGLSAAKLLADLGLKVVVIESMELTGGRARLDPVEDERLGPLGASDPKELAEGLAREAREKDVKIIVGADAYGLYTKEGVLGVHVRRGYDRGEHLLVKAKQYIVASGAYESPGNFTNNDMPGVLYDYALRRLLLDFKLKPSAPVLIVGEGEQARRMRMFLESLGVGILGPYPDMDSPKAPRLVRVEGGDKVERAVVEEEDGKTRRYKVDFVVLSKGLQPAVELLGHAGVPIYYDEQLSAYAPEHDRYMGTPVDSVVVAGEVAGARGYAEAYLTGEIAGLTVAIRLLGEREDLVSQRDEKLKLIGGGTISR